VVAIGKVSLEAFTKDWGNISVQVVRDLFPDLAARDLDLNLARQNNTRQAYEAPSPVIHKSGRGYVFKENSASVDFSVKKVGLLSA